MRSFVVALAWFHGFGTLSPSPWVGLVAAAAGSNSIALYLFCLETLTHVTLFVSLALAMG